MSHPPLRIANSTKVAVIYSTSADADEIAKQIGDENNVETKAYQANVSDPQAIEAVLKQITSDFGKLDIVVANAGIANHHAAEDYTQDQYSQVMRVNLDGAFYTAQAAARIFKQQFESNKTIGNLIFTASVSALLVNVPQKQVSESKGNM